MEKYQLKAKKRTLLGRKVKQLRKKGLLPGNLYGREIKSCPVEVDLVSFKKVFRQAGETKIVELYLGEKEIRPVLIHNVAIDPLTDNPLHVDFYQVNLKEKITAKVPIILTGQSPAVNQKIGLLIQTLNEVEIEALPTNLPEKLMMDVSSLTQLDQELKVADLKVPSEVKLLTDTKLTVVRVSKLVSKEAEALTKEEEAAKAQAAAQTAEAGAQLAGTAASAEKTTAAGEKTPAASVAKTG